MTDKGEKQALRKPEFVKIKDLERGRSGYNVYVKVTEAKERQIDTKDGQKITMVDAVVADETGSARAFFKGEQAKGVKEGAVIAIRNGVKKIIKGHISLELDLFGRVTVETVEVKPSSQKNISDEEIKFEPRNRQRRPRGQGGYNRGGEGRGEGRRTGGRRDERREEKRQDRRDERRDNRRQDREDRRDNRRVDRDERRDNRREQRQDRPKRNYDRDYDRRERNFQTKGGDKYKDEKRTGFQQKRGERKPMLKINEIDPGAQNIRFIAKVLSVALVTNSKGNNLRCQLGDETGVVNAFLSQSQHLVVGRTVALFGAEAKVVREHIEIQRARVQAGKNPIQKVNEKFNLSQKAWVPVD